MSRRSDRIRDMLEEKAVEAATEAVKPQPKMGGLRERRVEWLSWGLAILIFGGAVLVGGDALTVIFPVAAGGLLLLSAILQKVIKNWNVSIFTWMTGALLSAFGIEELLRQFQEPDPGFQFVYFFGMLVIVAGTLIILQIFRRA